MKEEIKGEIEVVEISVISQDAVGKGNGLRLIGEERTEVNELPGGIPISSQMEMMMMMVAVRKGEGLSQG